MTDSSTLAEYNVAPLDTPVCLDGAKRDRLVWIGDFYHTGKVIASSTARWDYILGSIRYAFSYQATSGPYAGYVPISAYMGTRPEYASAFTSEYAGLQDYQDLFLAAIGDFFWRTADTQGLEPLWSNIKKLASARMAAIDPYSGLTAGENASFFIGAVNGTAVSGLQAYAFDGLVHLAQAFGDEQTARIYASIASKLRKAINQKLWKPVTGAYAMSLESRTDFSAADTAWAILSGTANSSQAASAIKKTNELKLGIGYKSSSTVNSTATTQLSPNILGMLLEGLFKAHRDLGVESLTVARTLLNDFWSKMVTQNEYYTGASWEYLYPDGSPGIDLFTSHAHPWGAAPTYVLPTYVLGVSSTSPGYKTWQLAPCFACLGLSQAKGSVDTPHGSIHASWKLMGSGKKAVVTITAPSGTHGTLVLPEGAKAECKGKKKRGSRIAIAGGGSDIFQVYNL